MAKDVEHFLKYLSAILDSSVESSLFRSVPPLFFYWIIGSFDDQFLEFFVYFGDQTSVWCGVGEDLLPFCRLSFCLVDVRVLFSFRRSHLLIVSLSVCAVGVIFRKWFPVPMRSSVFPTFSSIRFSVANLTLKSLIHFKLSFVHDRYLSIFILLHADIPLC